MVGQNQKRQRRAFQKRYHCFQTRRADRMVMAFDRVRRLRQRRRLLDLHLLPEQRADRKSTRLNSSHANISYAVFCLKKIQSRHHTVDNLGLNRQPIEIPVWMGISPEETQLRRMAKLADGWLPQAHPTERSK